MQTNMSSFGTWERRRISPRILIEVAFCGALFVGYRMARTLSREQFSQAFSNARRVIRFEQVTGLFVESDLQSWIIGNRAVVWLFNGYYVGAHFPITVATLALVYIYRAPLYGHLRRSMLTTTVLALIIHVMFPLAPPRMVTGHGFVDTLQTVGPTIYDASAVQESANQIAAMPSLHFGWALFVAYAAFTSFRSRWRYLVVLHPLFTLLSIVFTANHYIIDALVAAVLVVVAIGLDNAGWALWGRLASSSGRRAHAVEELDTAA